MSLNKVKIILFLIVWFAGCAFGYEFTSFGVSSSHFSPNSDGIRDTLIFSFTPSGTETVVVDIYDASGQTLINRIFNSAVNAGQAKTATWTGVSNSSYPVADGTYIYSVRSAASSGYSIKSSYANKFSDEYYNPVSIAVHNKNTVDTSDDIVYVAFPYMNVIRAYYSSFAVINEDICPSPLLNMMSTWYLSSSIAVNTNGDLFVANYRMTNVLIHSNVHGTDFSSSTWNVFWAGSSLADRPTCVECDGDTVYIVKGMEPAGLTIYVGTQDMLFFTNTVTGSTNIFSTTPLRDIMNIAVKGDTIYLRNYNVDSTYRYRVGMMRTNKTFISYDTNTYIYYYGMTVSTQGGVTNIYANAEYGRAIYRYTVSDNTNVLDTSWVFGGFGTNDDRGYTFCGLAYNELNGELFVADSAYTVKRFDQNGFLLATLDLKAPHFICQPIAVAFNPVTQQYMVTDYNAYFSRVHFLDYNFSTAAFTFSKMFGSFGQGLKEFWQPRSIASDPDGYVYIGDWNNQRILKYSSSGEFITSLVTGAVYPSDIEWYNGRLYVTDQSRHRVYVYNAQTGAAIFAAGQQHNTDRNGNLGFQTPIGIAVTSTGKVYVADYDNYEIEQYQDNGAGALTYVTNFTNGSGANKIGRVVAVEADADGNIYFSRNEDGFNDIYKLNPATGAVETIYDTHNTVYCSIYDFTVDNAGNVVFPEYYTGGGVNRGERRIIMIGPDNGHRGGSITVDRVYPEARIRYPVDGETYGGNVNIIADVNDLNLYRYTLHYSTGSGSVNWFLLSAGTASFTNTTVINVNLEDKPDEIVNFKLTAEDYASNVTTHTVTIKKTESANFAAMQFLQNTTQIFTNNRYGISVIKSNHTIDQDGLAYLSHIPTADLPGYDLEKLISLNENYKIIASGVKILSSIHIRKSLTAVYSELLRDKIGFYYYSGQENIWKKGSMGIISNTADEYFIEGSLPQLDFFGFFMENDSHTNNLIADKGAYPSPVSFFLGQEMRFSFTTPKINQLTIRIFDRNGRQVREVYDGPSDGGFISEYVWDGLNDKGGRLPSGVYFYIITVARGNETGSSTGKIVVFQ